MDVGEWWFTVCVVLFTAVAAFLDAGWKRLPNWLTVPACLLGVAFHAVIGGMRQGPPGILKGLLFSLGGFAIGFVVLLVLWLIGGGGGGDVKFMGALGAWLGPTRTLAVLVVTLVLVIFGSLLSLAWKAMSLGVGRTKRQYLTLNREGKKKRRNADSPEALKAELELASKRRLLPYAVPAALGTWCVLALAHWEPALSRLFASK